MLLLEYLQIPCIFHFDIPVHFRFSPYMQDCALHTEILLFSLLLLKIKKKSSDLPSWNKAKQNNKDAWNLYFGMPEAKKDGL